MNTENTNTMDANIQITLFGYPVSMNILNQLKNAEVSFNLGCEILEIMQNNMEPPYHWERNSIEVILADRKICCESKKYEFNKFPMTFEMFGTLVFIRYKGTELNL